MRQRFNGGGKIKCYFRVFKNDQSIQNQRRLRMCRNLESDIRWKHFIRLFLSELLLHKEKTLMFGTRVNSFKLFFLKTYHMLSWHFQGFSVREIRPTTWILGSQLHIILKLTGLRSIQHMILGRVEIFDIEGLWITLKMGYLYLLFYLSNFDNFLM